MFGSTIIDYIFKGCITFYIPVVFGIKYYIDGLSKETKNRISDTLSVPWALWCFSLSLFSTFGSYYLLYYILFNSDKRVLDTSASFWYKAFIISKAFELIDTIFIVCRSKPLVALQWYHHWVTMTICYYVSDLLCDQFSLFFLMNYIVHSFMYLYFGLYVFFRNNKYMKIYGTFVNIIQTIQMLFAVISCIYIYNQKIEYRRCNYELDNTQLVFIFYCILFMYTTYLTLFVMLFFERNDRISNKIK